MIIIPFHLHRVPSLDICEHGTPSAKTTAIVCFAQTINATAKKKHDRIVRMFPRVHCDTESNFCPRTCTSYVDSVLEFCEAISVFVCSRPTLNISQLFFCKNSSSAWGKSLVWNKKFLTFTLKNTLSASGFELFVYNHLRSIHLSGFPFFPAQSGFIAS